MKWYREAGSKNHAGARKQPIWETQCLWLYLAISMKMG
jgi:hypothetical protein